VGFFPLALEGLTAGSAAGLALAGFVALSGLYLLKPRRRRVVVAFAPLWVTSSGERRAERWARRLRRWLSLALQLAVLGALLVAAADPRPVAADRLGRSVVVLVDRSASMSATDEPGTRLGAARDRARALVTRLGPADRALVASFAADVTAETGFETDGERLSRALDRITPSEEPGDLPHALAFAASVVRGQPHPTIVLVSDGAFSEDARRQVRWTDRWTDDARDGDGPVSLAGVDVRWERVGGRARNVAILGFAARRSPADPTTVEAALTVRNFGDASVTTTLEISAGTGHIPVERVPLSLAPGETHRHVLADVASHGTRLEARLVGTDALALDDHAYAAVPGLERRRVLRVGDANLYLDGALLSAGGSLTVARARAAAAETTRPRWDSYDAVIFDGVAPTPAPTTGHFLYLAPQGPGSPLAAHGTMADPVITDVRRGHPLVRQLDLGDVNIAEATRLTLAPGDVAVASSFAGPLIVARERPGLRVAAIAFDVRRSDLPLRPAFPLLLANALAWLGGSDAREVIPAVVGGTARVPAPRGAARVVVIDPTGARATWSVAGDVVELPVRHAGFYRVGEVTLAANASDVVESDTTPVTTLALGGRALPPPDAPAGRGHRTLATWALLVAAALLLLEWVTTHRRWTV
jgi:von Willebrand factor type A domain/Aerotolerance regulator N-terminal